MKINYNYFLMTSFLVSNWNQHTFATNPLIESKKNCFKRGECHTVCSSYKSDFNGMETNSNSELLIQKTIDGNRGFCLTNKGDKYRQLGITGSYELEFSDVQVEPGGEFDNSQQKHFLDYPDIVFQQELFLGQGHNLPDRDCLFYAIKAQSMHSIKNVVPLPLTSYIKSAFRTIFISNLPKSLSSEYFNVLRSEINTFLNVNKNISFILIDNYNLQIKFDESNSNQEINFIKTFQHLMYLFNEGNQQIYENKSGQIMEYISFRPLNIAFKN